MKQSIVRWFVVRVKPKTEKKIEAYLNRTGTKNYLPLQSDGNPLLPGLIFVHVDSETAFNLPKNIGLPMDFVYDSSTRELQFIPDRQMEDFIFLQTHSAELIPLPEPEKLTGGVKVRVIGGKFSGVEGEIYRIKGHKRVVARLGTLGTVALGSYVAKEYLEVL